MKVALICDSPLLNKTLELHLQPYLTGTNNCDFIVSDHRLKTTKPIFLVGDCEGSLLKSPFSKQVLLEQLESFYQQTRTKNPKIQKTLQNHSQAEYEDINTEIPKKQRARYNKNLEEAKELLEVINPSKKNHTQEEDLFNTISLNHPLEQSLLKNPKFLADLQTLNKNFMRALMALISKYEK